MVKRSAWTQEEDERLISFVTSMTQDESWNEVAKKAGLDRSGKSCWGRWSNYLLPGINKRPFTEEEDRKILQQHKLFGNRWAEIARLLGRTASSVKNRWYNHLKAAASDASPVEEEEFEFMMVEFASVKSHDHFDPITGSFSYGPLSWDSEADLTKEEYDKIVQLKFDDSWPELESFIGGPTASAEEEEAESMMDEITSVIPQPR